MNREERLSSLLLQLQEDERACLVLHFQGYSAPKIAEILNTTEESVSPRIRDGIATLSALLNDGDEPFHTLLEDDD